MKCKNCNFTIRTNELEFIDGLECECKRPALVQDCKHLEDSYGDDWAIEITQGNENGLGLTFTDRHTIWPILDNIRFCPFCGDELK